MGKNKEMEKDKKNELKVLGQCFYCGQTFMMGDTIGGMTEEERNEAATCKCSCPEAKSYVRKKERRKKVDAYIQETFLGEKMQSSIKKLVEAVEDHTIEKATIKTPDGWNTTIYLDKDSYLNIKRKATKAGKELKA